MGGSGPGAQALFVWTPQRPDREQMWEGRRLGSQPEQLGEIKNNSIPGDWGNYSGREGPGDRGRVFRPMWSLTGLSAPRGIESTEGFKGLFRGSLLKLISCSRLSSGSANTHEHSDG